MIFRAALVAIAFLGLPVAAFAQGDAPAPPAKIADMAWLQGYWVGEGMGGSIEDLWGPPRAGVMLGTFRLLKADGSPRFYELIAVEEFEGSLRFVVKHFHPDWVGWEEKDQAVKMRLTRIGPNQATFGGIALKRVDDTLTVEVTIKTKDGAVRTETLVFKRRPL
jgi:hypothetical protein